MPIFPVSHAFRAGSKIRVTIMAAGGDRSEWEFDTIDDGTAENTILFGGNRQSQLTLGVLTGRPPRARRCRPTTPCAASRAALTYRPRTAAEAATFRRRRLGIGALRSVPRSGSGTEGPGSPASTTLAVVNREQITRDDFPSAR